MMTELQKSVLRNTYTKKQNQKQPAISWKEKFNFENELFFAIIWSEQKVDRVLLLKLQKKLAETR